MRDRLTVQTRIGTIERLLRDRYSLVSQIGNTPLLRLRHGLSGGDDVELYAKAEWFNPGGSVKDRPALSMLVDAERTGALRPGKVIIDATSGNTGIAYAMIGRAAGYPVKLALPANAGKERRAVLEALGAELVLTDPLEGTDGAQRRVKEIVEQDPGTYFHPDQYNNPANWQAHFRTTAMEIWRQTGKRITHFVAGLGTTGTFVGTSRRLKELKPSIRCVAVQPDSPLHGLEGLKHLPTALVPGIYDPGVADEHIAISTDHAYNAVRGLARREGIYAGVSSGAALAAALAVATPLRRGVVVMMFPDGGARYASEPFWSAEEGSRIDDTP